MYPQEWGAQVARLDRSRFQPWVLQYPSGMRAQAIVDGLDDLLDEVHDRLAPRGLVVVGHSMGGLLARAAIHRGSPHRWVEDVRLLATLSTPWLGQEHTETRRSGRRGAVASGGRSGV